MTPAADLESTAERAVEMLMLIVFWGAFASLGAGLLMGSVDHGTESARRLLATGLLSLMLLPALRLIAAIVTAVRQRDWLTLLSTVAVLAILIALTLRDSLSHG